jgi:hypothetical protein
MLKNFIWMGSNIASFGIYKTEEKGNILCFVRSKYYTAEIEQIFDTSTV